MNRVIITGNLGVAPEVRPTKSGTTVCNLSVATNERVKQNGEWVDHTEWHRSLRRPSRKLRQVSR